jgi:hypothetical protein
MNPIWLNAIRASAGGADLWYRAGGAPVPVGAYALKGAASQAAAQINLVIPGTNDLFGGVAPTWNATDGLIFNGVDQYLRTGITPTADQSYAMLAQFTNGPGAGSRFLVGSNGNAATQTSFGFQVAQSGNWRAANGEIAPMGANVTSGNLAIAGNQGYLNGVAANTVLQWLDTGTEIFVGCRNNDGTPASFAAYRLQFLAIYPTSTNHAVWIPAVAAAMAAL